jgi:hypothetical protein
MAETDNEGLASSDCVDQAIQGSADDGAECESTDNTLKIPSSDSAPAMGNVVNPAQQVTTADQVRLASDDAWKCSEMAKLGADWANLSDLDKYTRLKTLIDCGCSRRRLAKALGVSEGLIRELLKLEELTAAEKAALALGELSRRKALKRIHARKLAEMLERLKQKPRRIRSATRGECMGTRVLDNKRP